MTKRHFRAAVILPMATSVLGLVAYYTGIPALPEPLRDYLESRKHAEPRAVDLMMLPLLIAIVVASLMSFVGMLRFSRWARPMALVSYCITMFSLPLLGPTVEPAAATALYHLTSVLWGAMMALAYMPPVSGWFVRQGHT